MKKVLIAVSSIFVAALLIVNAFVMYVGEGNSKSQLLLGNVSSYAWGTYWDYDGSHNSNQIETTPSESSNNDCSFGATVTISVSNGTTYSLTGTLSQNVSMEGGAKVVTVNYNLGSAISSTSCAYLNYGTTYTHQAMFGKTNAFVRDCYNQDYVTICKYYSECNDLIRQAQSFAQALAAMY